MEASFGISHCDWHRVKQKTGFAGTGQDMGGEAGQDRTGQDMGWTGQELDRTSGPAG